MRSFINISFLLLLPLLAYTQQPDPFLIGLAKMEQKRYAEAIGDLSGAISAGNNRTEAYLNRAQCYAESGEYNSAISDLLFAEKLRKYTGTYQLARIYAITGKSDSAIFYLERHLSSSNKLPESAIKLDPAFTIIEHTPSWKKLWNKEWYTEFEILHAEINYLIKSGEYMDALDLIDQNLGKYAHRPQLFAARGEIFMNLENFSSAVTAYSKAIDITKTQPEYYIQRAAALKKLGKYDQAVEDLNKAIKMEPENFSLYIDRSWLYNELKVYKPAMEDISFYLELFPGDDHAIYQCGQIYFDQGSYLKALEMFNKCLLLDQSKAEYFAARGNTYLKTKTYKYAIRDYGMSLDLEADNPDVYLNKGLARFYLNDKEGACTDWQKAARYGSVQARELLNTHCLSVNQENQPGQSTWKREN
jgi:tetratricopeptide (TPR) repeat protein